MDYLYAIYSTLYQLACTVGLIYIFGLIIALVNKAIYNNVLYKAFRPFVVTTSLIGTPVHELSHAIMCVLFFHHIDEIKLYDPDPEDGVPGYVKHSYKNNFYQKIGNFFIGVAPIIVGLAILIGLLYWLRPDLILSIINRFKELDYNAGISTFLLAQKDSFVEIMQGFTSWQMWVFCLVGFFIALHMTLSKADLKGSLQGLIFVIIIDIILNIVGLFLPSVSQKINLYVTIFASTIVSIFMVLLLLMLVLLLILFIIKKIARE